MKGKNRISKKKKFFLVLGLGILGVIWYSVQIFVERYAASKEVVSSSAPPELIREERVEEIQPTPPVALEKTIVHSVPFTSQAPTRDWNNPLFQDGCEEASVLMAAHAGSSVILSPEKASREIVALAELSKDMFGTTVDTSASDTLDLWRKFTGREAGTLLETATDETMRTALAQGNILIVPVDGRKLGNPHFTPPGPDRHMLIVKGYDVVTEEYITNDPGTHFGEGYRYGRALFLEAMSDYPSGEHLAHFETAKRALVLPL